MSNRKLTKQELDKIQMLREKEGITFKALSERFGVSSAAIQSNLKKRRESPDNVGEIVGKDEIRS